ncbi:helix-turn-helix domain-containing protein [Anaerotruncus rubiinfantis]|uniref:helix-turn-helix domain-containing protein n=1 Tax=Anaerotruncus rubiinfantis TaxID=1720200 RepID=UPI00082F77CE|nr:helix-turn-helix domain-containing protein [Anaerotruncus rubiinfantis]
MIRDNPKTLTIDDLPTFFGPRQLAKVMGISKDTAYRLAESDTFPSARIGRRVVIHKDRFLEWVVVYFSKG